MKKIEQRTLDGLIDLREKAAAAVEAYAAALSELSCALQFDETPPLCCDDGRARR
jgi:hypothetical protein